MLSYLLGDHLGSSSVTTDANGAKTATALYKAFGETRYTLGALGTDYKFTGQREQAELGLYFYGARWFDPSLGRFTSPDTIVPTGTQGTQAWDRYAYVNNNPVRYTDPTGHQATNDDGGTQYSYDDTQHDRQRIAQEQCKTGNNVEVNCSYAQNHPYETAAFAVVGLVGAAVLAEEIAPVAIDEMLAASEASTVLNYTPVDLALSGEYDAYGEVFYSGARETAESWASANGGVTLGQTPEGQILAENVKGLDYLTQAKPFWESASYEFATNASGPVNVFLKAGGLLAGNIWANIEYPALLNNPFVTSISIYWVP